MPEDWVILKSWTVDSRAKGITVDPNQNIYFTNFYGVWKLQNKAECIFESTDDPEGILFHDKSVYICDSCEHANRIIKYCTVSDTTCTLLVDGCFENSLFCDVSILDPHCVTVDRHGDIYFTEDTTIRKINSCRKIAEVIAGSGTDLSDGEATKVKFSKPRGIVVGVDGTIYVCEYYGCRIRQIKDGFVTTVTGQLRNETSKDGKLKEATFNRPLHIAVDVDGTLLVAEKNSIRRIDLNKGIVTTLTGLESVKNISSMALDTFNNIIYVGTHGNQILKIARDSFCQYERFLWIGHLKENESYCHLSKLPKDIIKQITLMIRKM